MYEKIRGIIQRTLGREGLPITPDTDLMSEIGINSLELVELVCSFEEEFNINVPDKDIKKFRYIRDIAEYIEKKTA